MIGERCEYIYTFLFSCCPRLNAIHYVKSSEHSIVCAGLYSFCPSAVMRTSCTRFLSSAENFLFTFLVVYCLSPTAIKTMTESENSILRNDLQCCFDVICGSTGQQRRVENSPIFQYVYPQSICSIAKNAINYS